MLTELLRCPLCRAPFTAVGAGLRCPDGHTFDVARQGYANLLTGRAPAGAETAEMVDARSRLQESAVFAPVRTGLAARVAALVRSPSGLVIDVGAGTGYYLAGVLDALPGHTGLAVDVAKAAVRRAARAHPRAAAVVADAWRGLPVPDGCADAVLNVFAPRNGAEFHRVLRLGGALFVITPNPDHLAELIGPLGLLHVDPEKQTRLEASLGRWLSLVEEVPYGYQVPFDRTGAGLVVGMGPSAWHAHPQELAARLDALPEPMPVTISVTLRTYRPRDDITQG